MKKFILLIALMTGCSNGSLPKYALISQLRVLGLKATAPEIAPGDTIPSVSALVLDPDGNGRTVSYDWVGCLEMATSDSTRFTCEGATDRVSLGTGTTSSAGVVTVPATILSTVSTSRAFNGINYIVAVTVTASSESIKAFKRIVISSNPTKNTNPTLTSIQRNNVSLSNGDPVGAETDLVANITNGSYENYNYMNAGSQVQPSTEDLLITWFYTEGTMDVARTFSRNNRNHWNPPGAKQRSNVTLAIVIHDGRGGSDWKTVNLQ
jgi:hypothetical protein